MTDFVASWKTKQLSSFYVLQLDIILKLQQLLAGVPWLGHHLKQAVAYVSVLGAGAPAYIIITLVMWLGVPYAGFVGHAVLATAVGVG